MMFNPDVEMEEGEVTITSQKPRMLKGRGAPRRVMDRGGSGPINKLSDAIKGVQPGAVDKLRSGIKGVQASKKPFKSGGSVKSGASKRADGCATKGKTKGRMV